MNKRIKKKIKDFYKDYKLQSITLEGLQNAIKSQGYTIVKYNNIFNDKNVETLIESLKLEQIVKQSRGFTYVDSQYRFVFIHEDLTAEEKLMVLAHEEGHIYCNHFSSTPIIGKDVVEEHEANEFAHYLLYQNAGQKLIQYINQNKKAVIVSACTVIFLLMSCVIYQYIDCEKNYYGEYYLTSTGSKYHEEQCIFVKDKTNIHRMTVEEYESGDYEPCDICLPHSNTNTESGD